MASGHVAENALLFRTPAWTSRGFCHAYRRDGFLVVSNEIIEMPMCWCSRCFEVDAHHRLFKKYFHAGARKRLPEPTS